MLWRGVENQQLNAVHATGAASVITELLQLAYTRAKVVAPRNPPDAQLHSVELGIFLTGEKTRTITGPIFPAATMSAFGQKRTSRASMNDLFQLKQTLTRMAELLRVGGSADWASALDRANVGLDRDPEAMRSDLRRMFGGLGSINDIVLHAGQTMLTQENEDFDALRSKLFLLLHC